jgi:hypothetical protein
MNNDEMTPEQEDAAMDAAREWNAKRDHLHDIFSPYYNRGRNRNLALEKRGPELYAEIERESAQTGGKRQTREFRPACGFPDRPKKDGPDLDRE